MQIDTRIIETEGVLEAYITALPSTDKNLAEQARELFEGVKEVLVSKGVVILQERIFATRQVMKVIEPIRSEIYAELDDGDEDEPSDEWRLV